MSSIISISSICQALSLYLLYVKHYLYIFYMSSIISISSICQALSLYLLYVKHYLYIFYMSSIISISSIYQAISLYLLYVKHYLYIFYISSNISISSICQALSLYLLYVKHYLYIFYMSSIISISSIYYAWSSLYILVFQANITYCFCCIFLVCICNLCTGSADHLMVLRAVTSISAKWQELAEELGLKSNTIRDIAVENNTNRLRLSHALTEWLQKNYKYEVHGVPSWRCLAEATRPIDRDLSIEIDRAHGIR